MNGINIKSTKIIAIILVIVLIFGMGTPVFAGLTGEQMKKDADKWIQRGEQNSPFDPSRIATILKPIVNILTAIGIFVVAILGVVIGIKYVVASPDSKANLKKQLFGLMVSGVVVVGAYGIWRLTYIIIKELTS